MSRTSVSRRRGRSRRIPAKVALCIFLATFFGYISSDVLSSPDQHVLASEEQRRKAGGSTTNLFKSFWSSLKQRLEGSASVKALKEHLYPDERRLDASYHQGAQSRRRLLLEGALRDHAMNRLIATPLQSNIDTNDEESSQPKTMTLQERLQSPIRFQKADGQTGTMCYLFMDNYQAHWTIRWCPGELIEQGIRDSEWNLRSVNRIGNYHAEKSTRSLEVHFERFLTKRFPDASISLYLDGDMCTQGDRRPRMGAVVLHPPGSHDGCSAQTTSVESPWIVSVEEPTTCQYVLHVCDPASASDEVGQGGGDSMKRQSNSENTAPLTNNDAGLVEQTLQQIQHLVHTFLYQSEALHKEKSNPDRTTSLHIALPPFPPSRVQSNLDLIRGMFSHAYDAYMYHAYPASEIRPLDCKPTLFNLVRLPALTLIDSMDTFVLMNNFTEFARSVERLRSLDAIMVEDGQGIDLEYGRGGIFAVNQNVSVFETNIRVLGGLLSAHQLAIAFLNGKVRITQVFDSEGDILLGEPGFETRRVCDPEPLSEPTDADKATCREEPGESTCSDLTSQPKCHNMTSGFWVYDGYLLKLAEDIGKRLLPAFRTKTGIPYGTVNLLYGVPVGETTIASLAGGGTLSLEMELLSRLSGDPRYGQAARHSTRALWMKGSPLNLYGKHICTKRGDWTESLSGIGSNSDSFLEYMMKHYMLFPEDKDFWLQLYSAYGGVYNNSRVGEWYPDVEMKSGNVGMSRTVLEALMAFYPGMQAMLGELIPAARSLNSFFLVREHLGFLPERFDYGQWQVEGSGGEHFLRPELIESAYFLHRATKGIVSFNGDFSGWQWAADFALQTIEKTTRSKCGYASVKDLTHRSTGRARLMNEMPSFFLSETLKYLYLIFDENNVIHNDVDREWIFTTEAHPMHHVPKADKTHRAVRLDEQKGLLIDRLRLKMAGEKHRASHWDYLANETWTMGSQFSQFATKMEPIIEEVARNQAWPRRQDDVMDHQNAETYRARTESGNNLAEPSFSKSGRGQMISKSCPNLHRASNLWTRALYGGALDYADTYVSSVQNNDNDEPLLGFMTLRSDVCLNYFGSGLHHLEDEDLSRLCPASDEVPSNKPAMTNEGGSNVEPSRFNLGGDLGSFDISAFPGGGGFYIQHVESGATLKATVLDKETSGEGKLVQPLVFVRYLSSGDPGGAPIATSALLSDLQGHTYACQVDILLRKSSEDDEDAYDTPIGHYPCAPALFGPTTIDGLVQNGDLVLEASLMGPPVDDEFGCSGSSKPPATVEKEECDNLEPQEKIPIDSNSSPRPEGFMALVRRGRCPFQTKSRNQQQHANAVGVIVINYEDDELFVMSPGGVDSEQDDSDDLPTVLLTGADGETIEKLIADHVGAGRAEVVARIHLNRQLASVKVEGQQISVEATNGWPVVKLSQQALQIFTPSGWGVHAAQRYASNHQLEWQLYLMRHEISENVNAMLAQ